MSHSAHAADHLVINEVYPAPTSGDKEWVELYNPTDYDIDLIDYSLKDGGVAAKNLSGTILSLGYFVYEISSGWLNNSGETLALIYKPTDTTIDQLTYGDWLDNQDNQPLAPSTGKSLQRIPNGDDANNDLINFRVLSPSKGLENILPVYSNQILLNELTPEPATTSGDEFFELYNNGLVDVDLSNWQLDDIVGGSSPYTIPDGTMILAGGFITFYNTSTHISLNDSGDSARLLDPNGDLKNTILYDKAIRGQSYSKFADGWQWTTTLSPGAVNVLTVETPIIDIDPVIAPITIQVARTQPDNTAVIVTGTVTVVPGTLGSQYFYIQDDTGGLQIYNYGKSFPLLHLGDIVQVTGELTTYQNERRIKTLLITDIIITGSRPPPVPIKLKIDDLNESFEGEYIQVTGTVTKTSGDTFYIHGSGELKVIIRSSTGINKPRMSVGDKVQIAGIYSQSGDSYRILPTVQDDVKIIGRGGGLPESGSGLLTPIILSLIITISAKRFTQFKRD